MGRFDGYLILSDIDGTLTAREGGLSDENLRAIEYFQSEGGCFTLSTGRTPDYLRRYPFTCNAPLCTVNGTLLTTADGIKIRDFPLSGDHESIVRRIRMEYPSVFRIARVALTDTIEWLRGKSDADTLLSPQPCLKYVFALDTEADALRLMTMLREEYGDRYECERSWPIGVELHEKGTGKGPCLHMIRALLPQIHTAIAVGDYENDISMLEAADIGCAVANAAPHVQAAADRVIVSNDEHAIAHIVYTVIPAWENEHHSQK